MNIVALSVLLIALVGGLAIVGLRRRRARVDTPDETVFARVQQLQEILWTGVPLTIVFDYQPYLKETSRHRVNVHTVQKDEQGVYSIVGYCHDLKDDRVFLSHSIRGDILVEKTDESIAFQEWLSRIAAGQFD